MRDVKVIGGEEFISQHKLLVGDIELNTSFSKSRCTPPKRKLWKLSNPEVRLEYGDCVHESAQSFQNPQNSDSAWVEIKTCLLNARDINCGWTQGGKPKRKETWWWNDEVDSTIKEKDYFGKSGRRVETKKSIFKQKGRQSQLYTLQGKEHKKTNLVILKAMINVIKSLRKLVE